MANRIALPIPLRLKMLDSVLDFMNRSGMSESTIRESFETCLADLTRRQSDPTMQRSNSLSTGNENVSAELLRIWHRDGRYIDGEAKPRPLFLSRGRNNLRSIIRRLDPKLDAAEVLREMKAVRLIRKTTSGKYLPNSESAIVSKLHPLAIDHIAKLVIRLVSTVSRNVDQSSNPLRLIERHAYAPDLNWSEREAFAQFTRIQGMAYLESVDNWLARRRSHRATSKEIKNTKGIAASVHLFAYLGDDEAIDPLRVPGASALALTAKPKVTPGYARKKRATPAREARA